MNAPPRHVHFIAIGGTGMGALAGLLKARGLEVTNNLGEGGVSGLTARDS